MDKILNMLPAALLPWFAASRRDLPWRQDREPYHVWLSEIMLQQTRVEAVRGYYARFLAALPTIAALASAPDEQCHKLWEGLGYYSRVRNLQKAAQEIMERHGGVFPRDFAAIRALSGVGDYTAGAISSICFDAPTPAVDGNVLRVCARLREDAEPINRQAVKNRLRDELAAVYPTGHCGDFTQALMELGATVCLPNGAPRCDACPMAARCLANRHGTQMLYPKKDAKKPRRTEEKTVFILRCGDQTAVCRRADAGLLAGLWEYPNVTGKLTTELALRQAEQWGVQPLAPQKIVERVHIFTHIRWELRGVYLSCGAMPTAFRWVTAQELARDVALPTAFKMFSE